MDVDLDPVLQARLAAQAAGQDTAVPLRIASLQPGAVGRLDAEVRAVGPARTYQRKRGGEGLLQRVTLADASGEIDLVLWDDETQLTRDGPLQTGVHVRIHGPLVKAGLRGGVELGLAGAHLVRVPGPAARTLTGTLLAIGDTRPVGDPPALRFTCDLEVATVSGPVHVVAWDAAVKSALQAGVGARIQISGRPNPFLDGWWTAESLHRVERNP